MSTNKPKINDLEKLFNRHDRGIMATRGTGGILARMLRQIWATQSYSYSAIERKIARFVERMHSQDQEGTPNHFWNRSNVRREMAKPSLTWRKFLIHLSILEPSKVEFTTRLYFGDDPRDVSCITVTLSMADIEKMIVREKEGSDQEPEQTE